MKTFLSTLLKIVTILLFAAIVAGIFTLVVNNTSIAAGGDGHEPPVMTTSTDSSGQTTQLRTRPEGGGDHESASFSRGLGEVGGSMLKLGVIVAIVLLIEKGFSLASKRPLKLTQN